MSLSVHDPLFTAPTDNRPPSTCARRCSPARRRIAGFTCPQTFPQLDAGRNRGVRRAAVSRDRLSRAVANTPRASLPTDDARRDVPRRLRLRRAAGTSAHDRVHRHAAGPGPTASFKDFAARMMARLIGRFLREDGQHADHPHRHQRRHRLGRGQRLPRRRRHPRHRAVPDRRGQRPPAQADDHAARQRPHHRAWTASSTTARRW